MMAVLCQVSRRIKNVALLHRMLIHTNTGSLNTVIGETIDLNQTGIDILRTSEHRLHSSSVDDGTVLRLPTKPVWNVCSTVIHSTTTLECENFASGEPRRWHDLGGRTPAAAADVGDMGSDIFKHFEWISRFSPCFGVNGSKIKVLDRPKDFYASLKALAEGSRKRIVLASLYLGTGHLERELVDCIHSANERSVLSGGDLRVKILVDLMRGSRGAHNSRTMLLRLVREFGERVSVALYHTPDLRGIKKSVLPERYNETVGVSHLKVYLFDDALIMSGANLSDSYFTNRQDRYVLIADCAELADYFEELVTVVSSMSFQLQADDSMHLSPELQHCHPFDGSDGGRAYRSRMRQLVEEVTTPGKQSSVDGTYPWFLPRADGQHVTPRTDGSCVDTLVYPLVQMGPFSIKQDELVTRSLFQRAPPDATLFLASGYFNLTDHYVNCIINECRAEFDILTAAPEANGFFGARGVSGAIPDAYTYIARQFHCAVARAKQRHRISLFEYSRPGWTIHSKGLWYYLSGHPRPVLTLIGSPNFGYRSVFRDLEGQLVIVTKNRHLQTQLYEEQRRLYEGSSRVTDETFKREDRQAPLWVTAVTPLIKNFF